jgi:hypothetical protein
MASVRRKETWNGADQAGVAINYGRPAWAGHGLSSLGDGWLGGAPS